MWRSLLSLLLCALALSACSQEAGNDTAAKRAAGPQSLPLLRADGTEIGKVTLAEDAKGLTVRIEAAGLEPGPHAVHFHTVGRCDAPSFESAGPHWNPTGKQHGRDNPRGFHLGDLANLVAQGDGRARAAFALPGIHLTSGQRPLVDLDGAALVIHADADDDRTDPSGASGDRIACAILQG